MLHPEKKMIGFSAPCNWSSVRGQSVAQAHNTKSLARKKKNPNRKNPPTQLHKDRIAARSNFVVELLPFFFPSNFDWRTNVYINYIFSDPGTANHAPPPHTQAGYKKITKKKFMEESAVLGLMGAFNELLACQRAARQYGRPPQHQIVSSVELPLT